MFGPSLTTRTVVPGPITTSIVPPGRAVVQRIVDKILQRNSECIGIDGYNENLLGPSSKASRLARCGFLP